jgi:hypothetical protein
MTSIRRKLVLDTRPCTQQAAKSKLFSIREAAGAARAIGRNGATPGTVAGIAAAPPGGRAAKISQSSTCSEMLRASSTSIPRYRTVLSSFVCPSRS